MPRWAIIAAPGDKRALGFRAALADRGGPPPLTLTWSEVAADPGAALAGLGAGDLLRIDSPGADEAAWTALQVRGGGGPPLGLRAGRWQPGAARHAGLAAVLGAVAELVALRGLRVMAHPEDILVMGDKAACRAHLAAAGVRVPPALPPCASHAALVDAMAQTGWRQVFIKPRWGSSGAGIIAYRRDGPQPGARAQGITTLVAEAGAFYNGKRLRTVGDGGELRAMIDLVLADGAVVERWIPKMTTSGGPVDLRVVAIAGRLRHRVARIGRGPLTNLHLDALRGDADALLAQAAPARRAAVLATAQAVADAFPRSHYLGMDLLLTHGVRDCLVGEVNAWGDLLPGLLHEGEDTFTAEIRAMAGAPAPVLARSQP